MLWTHLFVSIVLDAAVDVRVKITLTFEIVEGDSFVAGVIELRFSTIRRFNVLIDRCVLHLLKVFDYA